MLNHANNSNALIQIDIETDQMERNHRHKGKLVSEHIFHSQISIAILTKAKVRTFVFIELPTS